MQGTTQTAEQRFSYVTYDAEAQQELKEKFVELTKLVEKSLPTGRPQALTLTALEEAYMWTGKGIRDAQIARNGDATEAVKRGKD